MNIKGIRGIGILAILLIASYVIGTRIFRIQLAEQSTSVSSTWNNSKTLGSFNSSGEEATFASIPVVVVYKSKTLGDTESRNPLRIDISDKSFGALWVPVIKKSAYNFSVTCHEDRIVQNAAGSGNYTINGEISVSGHYKLYGTFSNEDATNLIVERVLNDIYKEVKKNLK